MIKVNDQLGNYIQLEHPAKRIVSLVPSQTELLHFFKLEDETVGITKFCIHPQEWFASKPRVGGTKNVNIEAVRELNPDLIIANKEENTKEDILALSEFYPIYISDVNGVSDALQMIKDVGLLCGKEQLAVDLIDDITDDFNAFPKYDGSAVYLIWKDPYMACGKENFIDSIINKLGFNNLIDESRYIELDIDRIRELNPDYLFLSSEPFPFSKKHQKELEEQLEAKVVLVDGEMFSWYGSRMLQMKSYFQRLEV
jgi:ABC-type Fe3+-hydroxamate transport system substrate-binding protein